MGLIIQSILLPKGVTFDQLVTQKGLEFLSDVDTDQKKEFDRYTRFDQVSVDKFEKESLKMFKISEKGVWVIGGKMIDAKSAEKAITLSEDVSKGLINANPMGATVAEVEVPPIAFSFGDLLYNELNAFMGVVQGVMSQTGRDAASRKADVMGAMDAFGSFLSMSLDALGTSAAKMNKTIITVTPTEKGEEEEMELFKTKEEFVVAVTDVLKTALPEAMKGFQVKQPEETAEEKKKREEEEAKKKLEESKSSGDIAQLAASVVEIGKQVKELAAKTDKIGESLVEDPGSLDIDKNVDPNKAKTQKSVFSGMFARKQASS